MLKINLLEKKTGATGPLADLLNRLGLSDMAPEDIALFRNSILKLIVVLVGIYVGDAIPVYFREKKMAELDSKIAELEGQQNKLTQEYKAKQAVRVEMENMNKQEAELRGRLTIISSLDSDRYRAFKVMDTVSLLIPERVWIENFTFSSKQLDFSGSSWEFIPINDFVSLLKQAGIFDNVRLKGISTAPSPKIVPNVPLALQTIKHYDVTMEVKGMAATVEKSAADKAEKKEM